MELSATLCNGHSGHSMSRCLPHNGIRPPCYPCSNMYTNCIPALARSATPLADALGLGKKKDRLF